MRDVFVQTKNVSAFTSAIEAAKAERGPKIVNVKGRPGYGKTRTCAWFAAQENALYVEAQAGWNIGWFLDDLCFELGVKPEHKLSGRSRQIKEIILKEQPVVLIDEADLLRHDRKVLETVKSIHDKCRVPVVLIGTGEIEQELRRYQQFLSRVCQQVEFGELSAGELPSVISQLSEVELDREAVEEAGRHIKTMRDAVRYIPHIERAVRSKQLKKADRELVRAVAQRMPRERAAA